jgi:hypothetical protein
VLAFVIQNHPHRAGADLGRKLVRRHACHGSTFSRVGASGKPGAVQSPRLAANSCSLSKPSICFTPMDERCSMLEGLQWPAPPVSWRYEGPHLFAKRMLNRSSKGVAFLFKLVPLLREVR